MEAIRQQAIAIVREDIGLGIVDEFDFAFAVESTIRMIVELDRR